MKTYNLSMYEKYSLLSRSPCLAILPTRLSLRLLHQTHSMARCGKPSSVTERGCNRCCCCLTHFMAKCGRPTSMIEIQFIVDSISTTIIFLDLIPTFQPLEILHSCNLKCESVLKILILALMLKW